MSGVVHQNNSDHRAHYTLEYGVWHATCRVCGFQVSDPSRPRAAFSYREHIKAERSAAPRSHPLLIDLTETVEAVCEIPTAFRS